MQNYFPNISDDTYQSDPLSYQAFGKRITPNQSLYEYLLEFLLVFTSAKSDNLDAEENLELCFHQSAESLDYYANPRMGLKRFIFFNKSKREGRFKSDEKCLEIHENIIINNIKSGDGSKITANLQDLLYGFAAVLKNRSWYAQSLIPLCPEMIFNESLAPKEKRNFDAEDNDIIREKENSFSFTQHDFMARGGEVYYLHVLQSVFLYPEYRYKIENGLKRLINSNTSLCQICNFVQSEWEKELNLDIWKQRYSCAYIPETYNMRSIHTCMELGNFLSTSLNPLKKIDLLAKGILLQLFRMMFLQACERSGRDKAYAAWIIDMRTGISNIKSLSESSYLKMNEIIMDALYVGIDNSAKIITGRTKWNNLSQKEIMKRLYDEGQSESVGVIKKLGKEMKFIIPAKGAAERFSLSEELLNFLVLSIIKPGEKLTFENFLCELYEHFGIIIGVKQIQEYQAKTDQADVSIAYFKENELAFKNLIKNCGYLKELSDATSIVFNPYDREEI